MRVRTDTAGDEDVESAEEFLSECLLDNSCVLCLIGISDFCAVSTTSSTNHAVTVAAVCHSKTASSCVVSGLQCVRGFFIATRPHSSFCGCAGDILLGSSDHMEDDDQNRESEEIGDTRKRGRVQWVERQRTIRHVMACG